MRRTSFLALCLVMLTIINLFAGNLNKPAVNTVRQMNLGTLYLNLENSLGIAINNNFQLKAIKSRGKIYDLTIIESWREYFPRLSLSYMKTEDIRKRESDTRQHKFAADTEFVVFDGGKRSLNYDIAKLKAVLARNDYRIALNQLIREINKVYLQILQKKDAIDIYQKTLERGQLQLKFIKKEYSLGEATRLNVLEIEAKVKEIELNYEQAKDDYVTSLNSFKLLLKIDWRQPIELIGSIEKGIDLIPLNEANIDELIAIAIRKRKEVESSEVELAINRKSYLFNKLYYFPKFSMGLNYSLTDEHFIPREKGWGINFKITSALFGNTGAYNTGYNESANRNTKTLSDSGSVNILDDMGYKKRIVESKIELNSAAENVKDVKQQISLEILNSYSALKNSWKMINIARKQLELYDTLLKIERLKANMGESRRYDLMEKEIERGEAAIDYLGSKVRNLMAVLALETAMGVDAGYLKLYKMNFKKEQ